VPSTSSPAASDHIPINYINETFGRTSDFKVEAANDQVPLTLFGRFVAYMAAWSQHSYEA
ncbi:MAG: hypothetical protein ACKVIF_08830, partial [Rhodospirillales bacterium]